MFTGLIEATGKVLSLEMCGEQARLVIELPFADELTDGESVAINGCCLTVVEKDARSASFDILKQTLTVTSLGELEVCLLYTSPSPRDQRGSRMPSSA